MVCFICHLWDFDLWLVCSNKKEYLRQTERRGWQKKKDMISEILRGEVVDLVRKGVMMIEATDCHAQRCVIAVLYKEMSLLSYVYVRLAMYLYLK